MSETETEKTEAAWCIAGNVVYERGYGPGGKEKRRGTKHFAPGAKVYIVGFFWGSGYEDITVVGRHRKSHRYITISIQSKWLTNWRSELVYSPYVIRELLAHAAYKPNTQSPNLHPQEDAHNWAGTAASKATAEYIIEIMKEKYEPARQTQPAVTRPVVGGPAVRLESRSIK